MRPQYIMFLAFALIVGNLLCLIIEGGYFGAEDVTLMNYLTGYSGVEAAGTWAVPKMIAGFFTHGFPKLIMWDFSFFSGGLAIIKWILFVFSIGAIYAIARDFIPAISQIFARR